MTRQQNRVLDAKFATREITEHASIYYWTQDEYHLDIMLREYETLTKVIEEIKNARKINSSESRAN